ncbi:L,D-transpeptidase [Enterovirga rhinocerotis]|uniref:Lipoprotein-anchoring transpeptidase ErfK/SrfK n=1 Tax=Enterovirga rhinocerotis TaxID=1339210 RepID=A0A4R7BJ55_9HYPH|nr:L,D-transpeptidase [Enterovirga rhinocerotis]TDR84492.1 lipoprotein-anchoring transpeptidase ErfK/SrfK [Enterovirga rhinocerotis]
MIQVWGAARLPFVLCASLSVGGCLASAAPGTASVNAAAPVVNVSAADVVRYGEIGGEPHPVPAVDPTTLKPDYVRQLVDYRTNEKPGTIVVDPHGKFLYLVMEGGQAMRYGVGVGKEGLAFTGTANIARKAQWPRWTPTPNMIRREPDRYGRWAGGVSGGEDNPLGARALYLHKNGKDTLYRIHGTNEPHTIGQAVSSGCIRMMNQDVIDLYRRVPAGSRVVVL